MPHKNLQKEIVVVTGVCPDKQVVLAAQSGFVYDIPQIIAVNNEAGVRAITFYDSAGNQLASSIPLPASGTFIWDTPNRHLPLPWSSGLDACLDIAGSVEVTAFFYLDDQRTPITKDVARFATFSNITITRAPTRFGTQAES